ncbi:MAG TPA: phosphoribosylanthranilate isomerase [Thermomicrobiales bacterium]|nr:phosphoribosylanthranilate isomerase [Thermomicrobiales bacterium]
MSGQALAVQVKVCGISEPEHALIALEEGADMIGLVFATSPRRVSVEQAKSVADAVREADPDRKLQIVGLFVNETAEHMNQVAREVGLDRIQLSGDEPAQIVNKLLYPAIGSIRADASNWNAAVRRLQDWLFISPWAVHMDTHVPGIYGGTGTVGDWGIAEQFARRYRLILAGGLTPENVGNAITKVKPFAVDVSSGVETDGAKDPDKIREFIRTAKATTFEEPESAYMQMIGRQL